MLYYPAHDKDPFAVEHAKHDKDRFPQTQIFASRRFSRPADFLVQKNHLFERGGYLSLCVAGLEGVTFGKIRFGPHVDYAKCGFQQAPAAA